jgi:NAD(P)-dependent dehydrogenase (short-subunit alcohol dehydrogenase family)
MRRFEDLLAGPLPTIDVAGRVVIITGAGQGLGRAYAHLLARSGARVVIAELSSSAGAAVAAEIADHGGPHLAVATDVTDCNATDAMAEAAVNAFGRIDALINNAALNAAVARRPFWQIPSAEWDAVMRVNVGGSFNAAKAVLPAMRRAGWGRIINISSVTWHLGLPNYLHYVTSKAAVVGMTRAMARELSGSGITVNAITLGQILTEVDNPGQTDQALAAVVARQIVPRSGVPSDVIGLMTYLLSPASDFMTGQSLLVDGGLAHQ